MEFKYYKIMRNIDFKNNGVSIGNYYKETSERLEMKAVRKYKDAIWDIQGLLNNSVAIGNNDFDIVGVVTLYGITSNDEFVVMRNLELNM